MLTVAGVAHAEPEGGTSPPAPSAEASPAGLHLLATAGVGASTNEIRDLELSPYGPSLGVDAGFTFGFGFRLGVYGGYSFGAGVTQMHDPLVGAPFEFTAETSSFNGGLSVGADVPLHALILRYSLGIGVTAMKWDFGGVHPGRVRYADVNNPSVGLHLAPGLAVLWPIGHFESGIGFDYVVQTNGVIPGGFLGKVMIGAKL